MNLLRAVTPPTAALNAPTRRGYLAAVSGALGGAVVGGLSTGGVAFALMECDDTGWDCLGIALVAAAIGLIAGLVSAVGGCYAVLRWRGYGRAGRTAGILAALLPIAVALSIFLAGLFTIAGPVIGIGGAAMAARRFAIGKPSAPDKDGAFAPPKKDGAFAPPKKDGAFAPPKEEGNE